jgi:hypothetical protein
MKFKPETHIVGKVYDLTQENMNKMIAEIENLQKENETLRQALSFYAETSTYEVLTIAEKDSEGFLKLRTGRLKVFNDMGKVAKKALGYEE